MAQIFLSYAREDRECAELFARELTARGWTVWWDRRIQVGHAFSEIIERELDDASCVIVLWSRHAVTSPWVKTEAEEAARRRVLVPVRIEDVRLPLEFRRLHTADLFEWRTKFDGQELDDCLASIEQLAPKNSTPTLTAQSTTAPQQITIVADAPKAPATLSQPAPATIEPRAATAPSTTSSTTSGQHASANSDQRPPGYWISQDGRQFLAPDLTTLTLWVEEGRVRADSQIYEPSLQQWIRAHDVAALRSVWQKRMAAPAAVMPLISQSNNTLPPHPATPVPSRPSNRGWLIGFAIGGLLLVVIIVSVASSSSKSTTTDTAATETTMTEAVVDTAASTTVSAADTMATDTATTIATDTAATVSSTDTATAAVTIPVSLKNDCSKLIFVAICYKNAAGRWMTSGWYHVQPNTTSPNVVQASGPNVYFYAEADDLTWKGAEGDAMTSMLAVRQPKFDAAVGELTGEGVRTVPFFGKAIAAEQSEHTQLFTCN